MQYTLRRIPPALDTALRDRARAEHKSLNEVALELLAQGLGCAGESVRWRDLRDLAGTWKPDRAFDEAIAEQDQVDEALWK